MTVIAATPVAILRSIGGLVFDATFREDHTLENEITDNPVETGVVVSDHMFSKPKKVTISAGVGDVSLNPNQSDPYAGASRSQNAYALLLQLSESFEPFNVQTGLVLYQNMVVQVIRASQDKDTSGSFIFECDVREVQIVSTQTITYPPRAAGKTAHQASPPNTKGLQQGSQVNNPTKSGSIASQIMKFLNPLPSGGGG